MTRIGAAGFPDRLFTKLKYEVIINTTQQTAGVLYEYVFRGNSLFDPDVTSAGRQPTYYDQYAAVYNKYRVHASSCVVEMMNDPSNASGIMVALTPTDLANPFSNLYDYIQSPYSRSKVHAFPGNATKLFGKMSTKKKLGLKTIANQEDCAAIVSANPSETWYWIIAADTISSTGNWQGNFMVKLTYFVEFFDRGDVASSVSRDEVKEKPLSDFLQRIVDARRKDTKVKLLRGQEEKKETPVLVPMPTPRVVSRK